MSDDVQTPNVHPHAVSGIDHEPITPRPVEQGFNPATETADPGAVLGDPTPAPFDATRSADDYTGAELEAYAVAAGVPKSGTKAEVFARLVEHDDAS